MNTADAFDNNLIKVLIEYDSKINIYERKINHHNQLGTLKNTIDVLGDIGGMFEVLHLISMFMMGYITDRIFRHKINMKIFGYYNQSALNSYQSKNSNILEREGTKNRYSKSRFSSKKTNSLQTRNDVYQASKFKNPQNNRLPKPIQQVNELF